MAKYFMCLVLLAFVALENNSIYNRLHANSYPRKENGNSLQHYTHSHNNNHRHKRNHRSHHPQQVEESQLVTVNNENQPDDSREAFLQYVHQQRHMQHQREHLAHHKDQYNHQQSHHQRNQHHQAEDLKTMPRLWQHLLTMDEGMYNDAPFSKDSDESASRNKFEEFVQENESIDEKQVLTSDLLTDMDLENDDHDLITNPIDIEKPAISDSAEDEKIVDSNESTEDNKKTRCPKCESARNVEHVSEEELTRLRIEFVKEQILEKLRLKERPNVAPVRLPKPIYEGATIEHEDEKSKKKELDDYYARTSKKFIFLEREKNVCQHLDGQPAMCFSFKIDDADAESFDVNTAVLWIYKNKHNKNKLARNSTILKQQTIVVSEVQQQKLDSNYLPIVKTIAIQAVDVQDEWLKIDIEWPIKSWFGTHDLSHMIHITCESCDLDSMDEIISIDKDYRPFIMISTQNRRRQSRQKRSINCTDGVTECCREKLYISFDEIGWGDWIIQPRGYDAYFCRGSCNRVASIAQSSSHHNTFLQKVMSMNRSVAGGSGKPLELIPCCTAKQYSSLQLVFMDSNNTATQKTFPNMVVESCGCR